MRRPQPKTVVHAILQILALGLMAFFGYETGCHYGDDCANGTCEPPAVVERTNG